MKNIYFLQYGLQKFFYILEILLLKTSKKLYLFSVILSVFRNFMKTFIYKMFSFWDCIFLYDELMHFILLVTVSGNSPDNQKINSFFSVSYQGSCNICHSILLTSFFDYPIYVHLFFSLQITFETKEFNLRISLKCIDFCLACLIGSW